MNKPNDYDQAVAFTGEFDKIKAGGHICKILKAEWTKTSTMKDMIVIYLDIAEGENKGFFKKKYDESTQENKKWPNAGTHRLLLLDSEGNTNKFFKGFMTAVEQSNSSYKWNWEEKTLKDKLFGAIFGDEEYLKASGDIGITKKIQSIRTVQKIKDGVEVPQLKKLKGDQSQTYSFSNANNDDDELPF